MRSHVDGTDGRNASLVTAGVKASFPACVLEQALWSGPPALRQEPKLLENNGETQAHKFLFFSFLSQNKCQGREKARLMGGGAVGRRTDTAVDHGTIGALWHQPLDSPRCSPKTLNSPTMNCCSGKGGFREFNFQHNWPYSTPLNAKEMVCSLCEELCL